jgi:two-component system chemotaxis sensor kinase CheA
LLQLVRNAVAHGIEAETERTAMGKPPAGRVGLHVERRGNRVVFVCQDDGRGLDVEAIRRAAVVRNLLSATEVETLSVDEALQLLLRGGVSTTRAVTEIAGRGVGLDIVRETVSRLKGDIHVRSEATRGTAIEISVPISIASLVVLVMEAAGMSVLLPFDAVRRTIRLTPGDIARAAAGDSILFEGEVMPFLPLATLWRQPMLPEREAQSWSAVVVQAGARLAAVGVDRLLGTARVMLRPLPPILGPVRLIAGASFDGEGNPQPVLHPAGLVEAVLATKASSTEAVVTPKPPVLVIDDSLTTRMLEQSILESAGYTVDLATCGEEALEKAHRGRYGLFIVDIEMPGMDGFTLIEHIRADPALHHIPAMLVSSRAAVEDRRRGEEQVGARAYMVKSEFDEGDFLRTIRSLIG